MEFTFTEIATLFGLSGIISGMFMLVIENSAKKREKKRVAEERKREEQAYEKEKAKCEHEVFMLESINASLKLTVITAKAVQTIPDANCNGTMKKTIDEIEEIQKKHEKFMNNMLTAYMH